MCYLQNANSLCPRVLRGSLPVRCIPPTSPIPRRGQRGYLTHLSCLPGTSLAYWDRISQETHGAVGKSQCRTAVAPAPPPGAARPPASQRLSARLAPDGVVSDPARPCLALPPRALTAAAASHDSASPVLGARDRRRCGGAARGALSLPEPGWSAGQPTHLVALVGLKRSDRRLGELHMQYGDVVLPQASARQPIALLFPQARRPPCRHLKLPGVPPPTPLGL